MANKGTGRAVPWLEAHLNHEGEECLFWPFYKGTGYGQFKHNGVYYYAHRYMCELVNGPAPTPKHQAAHSCGRGQDGCVNPRHLDWKTNGENQLDRRAHGTKSSGPKVTPELRARLLALKGEKTEMELAAMFGIARSVVHYHLNHEAMKVLHRNLGRERQRKKVAARLDVSV